MQQLLDMNRDIMFPVYTQSVRGIREKSIAHAPDVKMLTRINNNGSEEYISVVNKNYHVVENKDILGPLQAQMINYFDPIVLEDVQIKDTILKNGKVCYSEYIFPKIKHGIETDVGHKTEFGLRFVMKNSFDGQGSVVMWSGLIDFFCTNGTVTGKYDVTRKRHSRNFNTDGFINAFEVTMHNHKEIVDGYQRLADKKVKYVQVMNLFDTLTKVKDRLRSGTLSEKLSNQYNAERYTRGDNAFAVMSAMTHYASHGTGRFNLTRTGDQGTLYKRQEKVTNWLRSDTWKEFVAEAA
jgi:hypothetical protein